MCVELQNEDGESAVTKTSKGHERTGKIERELKRIVLDVKES